MERVERLKTEQVFLVDKDVEKEWCLPSVDISENTDLIQSVKFPGQKAIATAMYPLLLSRQRFYQQQNCRNCAKMGKQDLFSVQSPLCQTA